MSDSIPEYYRHLAEQRGEEDTPEYPADRSEQAAKSSSEEPAGSSEPSTERYRANAFQLQRPDGAWRDRSVYTLTGPTIDGIQHNITVNIDPDVDADTLDDFAAQQVAALEPQLERCRVLVSDRIALAGGQPAHRAIFVWYPADDLRLYQEQLYVLHEGRGYTLTASFTRATRKQLGPDVERMMQSFNPLDSTQDL